jgi:protein-tyrosine kinase
MSIVERALKRLQANGTPLPTTRRVFGKFVEGETPRSSSGRVISIDQDALRVAGLLAPRHQAQEIESQYRHIKRPLILAAMSKDRESARNGRLIMVASSLSGEGKTFTAINLAFSMAMEERLSVVLVDADVAKPQISKMFGAEGERGLLDMVSDPGIDLEGLIHPTDVPNLFLMPAGTASARATELLASDRMVEAMDWLQSSDVNRIFIFDSPPLLLTTEAPALAEVCGQVVVVVQADHTEHHILENALSRLPPGCAPSLILNQSTMKTSGYYYGYGAQVEA